MRDDLAEAFEECGGVMGTRELAHFFEIAPSVVSAWAEANGVAVIGRGWAVSETKAREFAAAMGLDTTQGSEEEESEEPAEEDDLSESEEELESDEQETDQEEGEEDYEEEEEYDE